MRLALDTNTLVGELLRFRGQDYVLNSQHQYFISERVLDEARHELPRRAKRILAQARFAPEVVNNMLQTSLAFVENGTTVVPNELLLPLEAEARLRLPRDPADWELVAVALLTDAGIWTNDTDFLGCGLVTWATDVLQALHPPLAR